MQRFYNVVKETLDKRYFAHCVNVNLTFTVNRLILTKMQR